MMKITKVATLFAATMLAAGGPSIAANVPESDDPIKVVMNDWTGQHVSTKIAGALLEKMGYTIEYVSAGALPQFPGLANGNLHFQAEGWVWGAAFRREDSMHFEVSADLFEKWLAEGRI